MNVNYGAIPVERTPSPERGRFDCWITKDSPNYTLYACGVLSISCVVVTAVCVVYPSICLGWPVYNSSWDIDLIGSSSYDYHNKTLWCEHNGAEYNFTNITKCVLTLERQYKERAACWVKGAEASGILIAAAVVINLIWCAVIFASTLRCAYTCPTPKRKAVPIIPPKPNDWNNGVHPL